MTDCKQCGECCKDIILPLRLQKDPQIFEWLKARGFGLRVGKFLWAQIPLACQHLTEDNLCAIWETRPKVCKGTGCKGDIDAHVDKILFMIDPGATQGVLFPEDDMVADVMKDGNALATNECGFEKGEEND